MVIPATGWSKGGIPVFYSSLSISLLTSHVCLPLLPIFRPHRPAKLVPTPQNASKPCQRGPAEADQGGSQQRLSRPCSPLAPHTRPSAPALDWAPSSSEQTRKHPPNRACDPAWPIKCPGFDHAKGQERPSPPLHPAHFYLSARSARLCCLASRTM